jgi:uncharacterized membrane protein YcaP (DUF421 family)
LKINYLVIRFLFHHDRIDRIVEGDPDVLIDHGQNKEDHLEKEFLTKRELEIAAHKQGFGDLKEIDHASLEPGGGILFEAKKLRPAKLSNPSLSRGWCNLLAIKQAARQAETTL